MSNKLKKSLLHKLYFVVLLVDRQVHALRKMVIKRNGNRFLLINGKNQTLSANMCRELFKTKKLLKEI